MADNLFENMENEVLELILREYPVLLSQLKNMTIKKRELTGVGFYTNFQVDDEVLWEDDMQISDVGGKINNSVHIGFVLFIEKGKLSVLEGYTYGSEHWPENIQSYNVFIEE